MDRQTGAYGGFVLVNRIGKGRCWLTDDPIFVSYLAICQNGIEIFYSKGG